MYYMKGSDSNLEDSTFLKLAIDSFKYAVFVL